MTNSTEADIVGRLRARCVHPQFYDGIFNEAAEMIIKLRAERDAAARDMVLVPKAALLWLSGAGPDADGRWFGQCEDEVIKMPRKYTPRYWWRSKFRSMIPDWPKDTPTLLATERGGSNG